jgi:anti-sigma-K factor RskA
MDCIKNNKQGVEILTDYCAGILNPKVAFEIDSHIQQCAECREMVEAQRTVWEMLDAWTPPEVSPTFDARLYARIAEERTLPVWRQWLDRVFRPATPYQLWKPAVSLAAAGAVAALALLVLPGGMTDKSPFTHTAYKSTSAYKTPSAFKNTTVQSAPGSEEIDLDQVQQALDDMDLLAPVGSQSASSRL